MPREDGKGLPRLVESTFSFLLRNSSEAIEYFHLPSDMVVEFGRQFAIWSRHSRHRAAGGCALGDRPGSRSLMSPNGAFLEDFK